MDKFIDQLHEVIQKNNLVVLYTNPLYRGYQKKIDWPITEKPVRKDRIPKDTSVLVTVIVEAIRKSNFKQLPSRQQSVYASTYKSWAQEFGIPYICLYPKSAKVYALVEDAYTKYFEHAGVLLADIPNTLIAKGKFLTDQDKHVLSQYQNVQLLLHLLVSLRSRDDKNVLLQIYKHVYKNYARILSELYYLYSMTKRKNGVFATVIHALSMALDAIALYFKDMEKFNPSGRYEEVLIESDKYFLVDPYLYEMYIQKYK